MSTEIREKPLRHWEDPTLLHMVYQDLLRNDSWGQLRPLSLDLPPCGCCNQDLSHGLQNQETRRTPRARADGHRCGSTARGIAGRVEEEDSGHRKRNGGGGLGAEEAALTKVVFAVNAGCALPTRSKHQQIAVPIFNSGRPSCVRIVDSDEYREEFLGLHFDREGVCDEDLFNPAVYPVSAADHEELAAAESFNWEMAELEALEHQEELRSLFQARITAVRQGSSSKQRPAKISSWNNANFSELPRGAPASGMQGRRFNAAKKCPHNINQPPQTGRYY